MIPDEIKERFLNADGRKEKVWAGANQTYRMLSNGDAKIVLLADDAKPPEIVMPIETEAKRKKVDIYYGPKEEIGKLAKCPRHATAACIV
jgi:ribosomal protein L7Ae-like RNA K-turn-binding protein